MKRAPLLAVTLAAAVACGVLYVALRPTAARRGDLEVRAAAHAVDPVESIALDRALPLLDERSREPRVAVDAAPELAPPEAPWEPVELVIRIGSELPCTENGPVVCLERSSWLLASQVVPSGTVFTAPRPGTYRVRWDSATWGRGRTTVMLPRDEPLVLHLEPPSLVVGRVVDGATQEPLPSYRWTLLGRRVGWRPRDEEVEVLADAVSEPAFCIAAPSNGFAQWRLRIEAQRYEPFESELVSARGLVDLGTIPVGGVPATVLQVSVVDAATAAPVHGALVRTLPGPTRFDDLRFSSSGNRWSLTTRAGAPDAEPVGPDGAFEHGLLSAWSGLEDVRLEFARRADPLCVAVWADGFEPVLTAPFVPRHPADRIEIALHRGASIRGELHLSVERSARYTDAVVSVRSDVADLEHRLAVGPLQVFSFEGLLPGLYHVTAHGSRSLQAPSTEERRPFATPSVERELLDARTVRLRAGEQVELVLGARDLDMAVVRGMVLAPDGAGWGRLEVLSRPRGSPSSARGSAALDGTFTAYCAADEETSVLVRGTTRDRRSAAWIGTVDGPGTLAPLDLGRTSVSVEPTQAGKFEPPDMSLELTDTSDVFEYLVATGFLYSLLPVDAPADFYVPLMPVDETFSRWTVHGLPPGLYELRGRGMPARRIEIPASGSITVR